MTPGLLRHALSVHAPDQTWPDAAEELFSAVEAVADHHPGDPVWTNLLLAAHDLAAPTPPLPEGLRPQHCVRVDRYSATWLALDPDGRSFLVRAPHERAAPVHHRILARDRAALHGLVAGVRAEGSATVAPAPGIPLSDAPVPPAEVVRLLADTLSVRDQWQGRGLSPGRVHPEEVRLVEGRVRVVCLTPSSGPGLLEAVVSRLPALDEGPIQRFIDGLRMLDGPYEDASVGLRRALAAQLGARAIELRRQRLTAHAESRRVRLLHVVERLSGSMSPPVGRGPIGYDLDGQPTHVSSDGDVVTWGSDMPATLFSDGHFDAPTARRFLRACATAPTRPETEGDPAMTETLGRWVSSGLKLRTVRLLLEKAG